MSNNQNFNVYAIIVSVLLFLSAGLGYFFWQKSRNYFNENEQIKLELQNLESQKNAIQLSLDSLSNAYASLRTENETLQGRINSSAEIVQQKEVTIQKIKSSTAKDLTSLRAQVEELKKTKIELETIITSLKAENESLKAENQRLTDENTQLKGSNTELTGQVQDLAKQLEEQIRKTQSATFKATSFNVYMERKNTKMTYRANKAREIFVSFDLADVPKNFQGQQKLYLVITDDKGNPIASANPVKTTVQPPSGPVEIIAQQVKDVVLGNTQRLSFSQKFDDKLKTGNYVVAIYCDKGLLGASTFKLV